MYILLLRVAVDRFNDLFLLGWLHADRLERLPCAAVRADENLIGFLEFFSAMGAVNALVFKHR